MQWHSGYGYTLVPLVVPLFLKLQGFWPASEVLIIMYKVLRGTRLIYLCVQSYLSSPHLFQQYVSDTQAPGLFYHCGIDDISSMSSDGNKKVHHDACRME